MGAKTFIVYTCSRHSSSIASLLYSLPSGPPTQTPPIPEQDALLPESVKKKLARGYRGDRALGARVRDVDELRCHMSDSRSVPPPRQCPPHHITRYLHHDNADVITLYADFVDHTTARRGGGGGDEDDWMRIMTDNTWLRAIPEKLHGPR